MYLIEEYDRFGIYIKLIWAVSDDGLDLVYYTAECEDTHLSWEDACTFWMNHKKDYVCANRILTEEELFLEFL